MAASVYSLNTRPSQHTTTPIALKTTVSSQCKMAASGHKGGSSPLRPVMSLHIKMAIPKHYLLNLRLLMSCEASHKLVMSSPFNASFQDFSASLPVRPVMS
ncbi:hypothetical protein FKM82_030072 [Ascaphus truei]